MGFLSCVPIWIRHLPTAQEILVRSPAWSVLEIIEPTCTREAFIPKCAKVLFELESFAN